MIGAGRAFWLYCEAGHKTLRWEVLYPKERSILTSKDRGTPRGIWTGIAKFPPVYCLWFIPFVLSYFSTPFYSSSSLCRNGQVFISFWMLPCQKKHINKVICFSLVNSFFFFLLLSCRNLVSHFKQSVVASTKRHIVLMICFKIKQLIFTWYFHNEFHCLYDLKWQFTLTWN